MTLRRASVLWSLAVALKVGGMYVFFVGFLPQRPISYSQGVYLNNSVNFELPKDAKFTHLVFLLIDAFRSDFVYRGSSIFSKMEYVSDLISRNETFSYVAKAKPPTVTMPRVKALMTGTVPGFLDILFNMDTNALLEDSIVSRMKGSGMNMTFFGDNTWLKLFPDHFLRSDGTTSFIVSDYIEVDSNVTAHLEEELGRLDWQAMFLHYLGLDHIGHLAGSGSPLIESKLKEMDGVIRSVYSRLKTRDKDYGTKSLFVICGDHGMGDTGSHGGASRQEVLTPMIFLSPEFADSKGCAFTGKTVDQVDLAPTISLLMGFPMPSGSIGVPIRELFLTGSTDMWSAACQQAACQLLRRSDRHPSDSAFASGLEEVCYTGLWNGGVDSIDHLLDSVSDLLQTLASDYNAAYMLIGVVLLAGSVAIFWICLYSCESELVATDRRRDFQCCSAEDGVPSISYSSKERPQRMSSVVSRFQVLGCLLALASFGSSSFIEEEHYVWYFLTTSLFVLMLIDCLCGCMASIVSTKRNVGVGTCTHASLPRAAAHLVWMLMLFRLVRAWNQTGVKWQAVKDLADCLTEDSSKHLLSVLVAGALLLAVVIVTGDETVLIRCLYACGCLWVYLVKASSAVLLPSFIPRSLRGIVEARVCFGIFCVLSLAWMCGRVKKCLVPWTLLVLLIVRAHNIPWASFILLLEHSWRTCVVPRMRESILPMNWQLPLAYLWLSRFTYFSQGNSNSLSSVDVAASVIGLHDADPTGTLMLLATYGGQLVWVASFVDLVGHRRPVSSKAHSYLTAVLVLTSYQATEVAFYYFLLHLQRYHLFIWSVFTPKYLYLSVSSILSLVVATPGFLLHLLKGN